MKRHTNTGLGPPPTARSDSDSCNSPHSGQTDIETLQKNCAIFRIFQSSTNFSKKQLGCPSFYVVVFRYDQGAPSVMQLALLLRHFNNLDHCGLANTQAMTPRRNTASSPNAQQSEAEQSGDSSSSAGRSIESRPAVKVCTVSSDGAVLEFELNTVPNIQQPALNGTIAVCNTAATASAKAQTWTT